MKQKCRNNQCLRQGEWINGICPKCEALIKKGFAARKKANNKPIKKRSNKRAQQEKMYSLLRLLFLKLNPVCAVTGGEATEIHHMKGRIGSLLTDTRYFLPVCREAHEKIELNPKWAKEMGYSLSRLYD